MKSVILAMIVTLFLLVGCIQDPSHPESLHPEYLNYTYQEALIWGQPFPVLDIQIHHAPDREPSQHALDILVDTLYHVTDKQDITITVESLPDEKRFQDRNRARHSDDLWALHDEFFTLDEPGVFANNGKVYIHILYLNGYSTNTGEERYRGLNMGYVNVLNPDMWVDVNIVKMGDAVVVNLPNLKPEYMERHVLVHEVGHSLGLVDNGIPMLHERIGNDGFHSRYPESVMYQWGPSNMDSIMEEIQDNQWVPYQFDQYDLEDIFSFRETGRLLEQEGRLPR